MSDWVSQAAAPGCTVWEYDTPPARICGSERIQGHEARIYKCGAQRHNTHGGQTMVVVAGIDVSKGNSGSVSF